MRFGRRLRIASLFGVAGFGLLQLLQPTIEVRPTRAPIALPSDVDAILRRSCFDCHSNETKLAWFDHIAPGSWLVARDVERGRAVLNFSELGQRPPPEQRSKLFEAIAMMSNDVMPPRPFRALHRDAAIRASDTDALKSFAATLAAPPLEHTSVSLALDHIVAKSAPPAPNGMTFPTDVASWTPVELSERWDNGTVRLILGNAVTVEAARSERFPWPDGASFAKVAFRPNAEGAGFVQIEVMKKVHDDWSWGRWLGEELAPYGDDASFESECRGCHEPMRKRDFVFSFPQTTFDPAWGRISAVRIEHGRFQITADRKIVWPQRDDPSWFGARISTGAPTVDSLPTE